jgi:hypothetical protein
LTATALLGASVLGCSDAPSQSTDECFEAGAASYKHAVLVYVSLSDDRFGNSEEIDALFSLEEDLACAVDDAGVGVYDGNEIGEGTFVMFLYGQEADALSHVVLEVLGEYELPAGSYLIKRYGEPGAREERVDL